MDATKSKGHVVFFGQWEFFRLADGTLVRADKTSWIGTDGYRAGARFECAKRSDGHRTHMAASYGVAL